MTPFALLDELTELGIELTAAGDEIQYRAPKGCMTEELKTQIRSRKRELLHMLRHPSTPRAVLLCSRYGCLTRGGLRDALVIQCGATREEAELVIGVAEELGQICKDEEGLYRVVH